MTGNAHEASLKSSSEQLFFPMPKVETFVRLRQASESRSLAHDHISCTLGGKTYTCTRVLRQDDDCVAVFSATTEGLVDDFLSGKNGLLLVYGQTASGTHCCHSCTLLA